MEGGSKKTTYACFKCRKHRSLRENTKYLAEAVACPQCQEPMKSIGHRLQVPRKDDTDAWDEFWLQYISPGYGVKGEPEIDAENEHFEGCKAKHRDPPKEDESTGCDRCDIVWKRMPEMEKQRWRTSMKQWWRGR